MAYIALYRRYRPNSFDELIGQEHIVKTLVNQIESGRLGHAYLFTGTRGTGKTSAAKIFAKAINCLNPVNGSPCGKCEACLALADASNIDVVEIDAASNNGVNEIRDLREKVQYPPVSCRYKVYIIDEVHMLTGAAFNALLKTLEEPPKHAVFILATTEVHKIPATILSRCMRFDFKLISNDKIAELISKIYDEQGKKYDKEAVFAIAKAGEGSIRDALSIADIAISYGSGKLTYNDIMEILGSSNSDLLAEFILDILQGNTGKVLTTVNLLSSKGKSFGVLTKDVTSVLRDLLIIKTCDDANKILNLPKEKYESLNNISSTVGEERLLRCLEIFSDAENSLKYSTHPRIIFETAAIKAAKPASDYNIDALVARIKDLELKLSKAETFAYEAKNVVNNPVTRDDEKNGIKEAENVCKNADSSSRVEEKAPNDKVPVSSVSTEELKGKLLFNLRKNGSELIWNVVQGTDIDVSGNVVKLTCKDANDCELLERCRDRLIDALDGFSSFELSIALSSKEKSMGAVDEAAERIKKIFGNDIVIIK